MHEVLLVQPTVKKPKKSQSEPGSIVFIKADLEQVQHPHNNPLVIHLWVQNYDVKKILVDAESSTEVMYYDIFEQLNLSKVDLRPAQAPLVEFNA